MGGSITQTARIGAYGMSSYGRITCGVLYCGVAPQGYGRGGESHDGIGREWRVGFGGSTRVSVDQVAGRLTRWDIVVF